MNYQRAKPQVGEWWVIEYINPPAGRDIIFVDFIKDDHISIGDTSNSIHIDQIDFIRPIDLWEGERKPRK